MGAPDQLTAARAAVGVGVAAVDAARGRDRQSLLALVLGVCATTAAWSAVGILVASRTTIADALSVEANVVDDRAIMFLAVTSLTAWVTWVLATDRVVGLRVGVGALVAGLGAWWIDAATSTQALASGAAVAGVGAGLTLGSLPGLVADVADPRARVGVLRAAALGAPLALLLAAGSAATDGAGWAGVVAVALGAVAALLPVRAPDMARDEHAVRSLVTPDPAPAPRIGRAQVVRRLGARATFVRTGVVAAAAGLLVLPVPLYLVFHVTDRFGMGADHLGVLALVGATGVLAQLIGMGATQRSYAADPGAPATRGAVLLAAAAVLLVVAAAVDVVAISVAAGAGACAVGLAGAARAMVVLFSTTPARLRPSAGAALAASQTLGALVGLALLAGIDRRFGTSWALGIAAVPLLAVAPGLARAATSAARELDRTLTLALGAEQIAAVRRDGGHVPLLECSGIQFSYGQVQVLFDVDFQVDEGEMVALLGTNGAGKSTLLRVISGLGIPQSGAVRLAGDDITFATATDRVRRGVTQVPGGKAVFGPMSVVENLRVYGYALGADRKAVDRGIETSFEVFPRLAERRNQTSQTLSGGEQQMLALSKALILEPRLLLIDELSLGLAPKIVAQLLEMVREINQRGTAIVLVEQSVNVALSLADHAYYMEKGEIRFDGPTADLLESPEILRSVYLKGAAQGLGDGRGEGLGN